MRACRRAFGKKWKHPKERNSFFPSVISENEEEAAAYPGHWEISKRRSCLSKKRLSLTRHRHRQQQRQQRQRQRRGKCPRGELSSKKGSHSLGIGIVRPVFAKPIHQHTPGLLGMPLPFLVKSAAAFCIPQCVTILATSYRGMPCKAGRGPPLLY